jgi:hypothetical protein
MGPLWLTLEDNAVNPMWVRMVDPVGRCATGRQ